MTNPRFLTEEEALAAARRLLGPDVSLWYDDDTDMFAGMYGRHQVVEILRETRKTFWTRREYVHETRRVLARDFCWEDVLVKVERQKLAGVREEERQTALADAIRNGPPFVKEGA